MLSNYKRKQAEAVLCRLDRDVELNLRAEYTCCIRGLGEAHFDRLMGKLDMLRAMKAITFNQQMLLMEYYMERRWEDRKKSA